MKALILKSDSRNIGCFARRSMTRKAIKEATPAASMTMTGSLVHAMGLPLAGWMPSVIPIMIEIKPAAKVILPAQSMLARWRSPSSRSFKYDQTVPRSPSGTETRKTSRQLMAASTPPKIKPMNDPLMPATLLIPSAIPRWLEGKASVRMADELATRNAAPMPWTIRPMMSHTAAACPVKGTTLSCNDASVKTRNPRLYILTRPNMSPSRPRLTTKTLLMI